MSPLRVLQDEIVRCRLCPRLVTYREEVARTKRRAYRDWDYWGKPVPGFGDPAAAILLIGLAPGAHGANRTGRMFTGDRSGDFLYAALYEEGLASQPTSVQADDGLTLKNVYIAASVRCAPPDNKPLPAEIVTCRQYLEREIELLPKVKVVIALGKLAFDDYLTVLKLRGKIKRRADFVFAHDREHGLGPGLPVLISSYHPSQQNTQTGKLTMPMFRAVFQRAITQASACQ
ncbi:MAG TPA: uracil-DNA glycosylase [Bryobacteraceae bacterium]|nr:uracil-DNA glycosylase [Bryobacteraceae bacterium]